MACVWKRVFHFTNDRVRFSVTLSNISTHYKTILLSDLHFVWMSRRRNLIKSQTFGLLLNADIVFIWRINSSRTTILCKWDVFIQTNTSFINQTFMIQKIARGILMAIAMLSLCGRRCQLWRTANSQNVSCKQISRVKNIPYQPLVVKTYIQLCTHLRNKKTNFSKTSFPAITTHSVCKRAANQSILLYYLTMACHHLKTRDFRQCSEATASDAASRVWLHRQQPLIISEKPTFNDTGRKGQAKQILGVSC